MKSNIFIPEKINVGFQNRNDTYTKKLAYIIYFDQKGVLRKETSWDGWRDKTIPNVIHENIPTSGFVLNKKVGDYCSDWNHRQAYVRVYDPRDFEFEITIENLLYILENASSIKGKGLEGEFIYGWDGKDLVLIPVESPDYKEISEYNTIIYSKNYIKAKDLRIGATYRTKQNEEWVYLGRFDYWTRTSERIETSDSNSWSRQYDYIYKNVNKGKYYYFMRYYKYDWQDEPCVYFEHFKNLGDKFISVVSEDCVENYAELFEKLECTTNYSPLDTSKDEYIPYTFEEFCNKFVKRSWFNFYDSSKNLVEVNKPYNSPNQCYYYEKKNYYNSNKIEGTFKEIYNKIQPMYKNEYLTNGKLYKKGHE